MSVNSTDSESIRRLKKYGIRDKSPTVSKESTVVEEVDKLECCRTNRWVGSCLGLWLWLVILTAAMTLIWQMLYNDVGHIQKRSKLYFGEGKGDVCPVNYPSGSIPWYFYYDHTGKTHCYWIAVPPYASKKTWWDAKEDCKNMKENLNNAEIGNTDTPGQKIEKSYLFIPETGDEFHRLARQLTILEQRKILFQRPNLTYHGNAEFWIGGRKCYYGYPSTDFPLNFIDYLWVPTNDVDKTIDEKNIFCQVGKIHHWYTYLNKTVKKSSGEITKKFELSGECWDFDKEKPQQRMSFLHRPFNVMTNKFWVEGGKRDHKRILEMEEAQVMHSYRHYFKEKQLLDTGKKDKEKRNCNYKNYGLDNDNVKDVMEDFLPFCVSLATYADPTKRNEPYNEKEEPEWTWYSYPCNWASFYICEAEMETKPAQKEENLRNWKKFSKGVQDYWNTVEKKSEVKSNSASSKDSL